jgi:NAD-dependent dihydropyrimidine dehydrogenase PreA subunit
MARPKKARVSWQRWQQRELPVLDERLCTSCGRCVDLCPTDCLEMAGPLPWMPRPVACISCTLCVLACPSHALAMCAPAGVS